MNPFPLVTSPTHEVHRSGQRAASSCLCAAAQIKKFALLTSPTQEVYRSEHRERFRACARQRSLKSPFPHGRELFTGRKFSRRVNFRNGCQVARLKSSRATTLFESRLAARHVVTFVRGKHFENCFPLRLSFQKLFNIVFCFCFFSF